LGFLQRYYHVDNIDLVNFFINNRISPFLQYELNKSAIIGGIKFGSLNTTKLIMSKKYISIDEPSKDIISDSFIKKDDLKNGLLHHSCYNV